MSARRERDRTELVRDWMAKAETDFWPFTKDDAPTELLCFHAQQGTEKYIKAVLVAHGIPFPKTHDIEELCRLVPSTVTIPLTVREQRFLTDCEAATRYPERIEAVVRRDAKLAVELAKRVQRTVQEHLACEDSAFILPGQ